MPEGPEVKNITDYLNSILSGLTLLNLGWDQSSKYYPSGPDQYDNLKDYFPARVERVFCKGKQIFFQLISIQSEDRFYFNSGLGMSGGWIIKKGKYSNLWLNFGDVSQVGDLQVLVPSLKIYFDDKRHFGNFTIIWGETALKHRLAQIGPDLLTDEVTLPVWNQILDRHKRCSLVSLLMNQSYISGIGNYLKAEILYRAKLKPDRKISSLSTNEKHDLWKHSLETIRESYQANGLTIKDYQDPLGRKGSFQIQIYGKTHDPVGNPVRKDKFSDNRTTHWVPALQI